MLYPPQVLELEYLVGLKAKCFVFHLLILTGALAAT